jgi:hypothetical protein
MRFLGLLLSIFAIVSKGDDMCQYPNNNCIQFTVGSGTGCDWMCNYCANQLGTNNYYFTDNVCTYKEGQGCIGSPIAGKQYTCCSA